MTSTAQSVPEAPPLQIRISPSDDESDGEQQDTLAPVPVPIPSESAPIENKESSDDLSQLAITAEAAAEAVMRPTGTVTNNDNNSMPVSNINYIETQEKNATSGDNVVSVIQQQQQQVYYIPSVCQYPATPSNQYTYVDSGALEINSVQGNLIPSRHSSQTSLTAVPQVSNPQIQTLATVPNVQTVPNVPAGTVVYQVAPPQSPMPSSHIVYQVTTPQPNYQTVVYQIPPNTQYTQPLIQPNPVQQAQMTLSLAPSTPIPHDQHECQQQYMYETQYEQEIPPPSGIGDGATPIKRRGRKPLTVGDFIKSSDEEMVYPMVYVSPAGLLTVMLKHDVTVEMTLDKTLRVVNHKHKAVAASNSKGTSSCIFHSVAKVYQDSTSCDAECFVPTRQVAVTTESMKFARGFNKCYRLNNKSYEFTIAYPSFRDLSQDMSVSLLFSSTQYGPHFIEAYQQVANAATYKKHSNGAITVYINGLKIYQYQKGDVVVQSGRRYIRVSPEYGSMMVGTHFVEILLENAQTLKVRRGDYRFKITEELMVLSDGYMECGIDKTNKIFCQREMLLVRTIIDNRLPCDVSCTGSREEYKLDYQPNYNVPLPGYPCPPHRSCPPQYYVNVYDRHMRRRFGWWPKRGRSHYTIDLETAIRMSQKEKEQAEAKNKKKIMDAEPKSRNSEKFEKQKKKTAVVSITEAVQRPGEKKDKSGDNAKEKLDQAKNKPRLWSSIVISPEKPQKVDDIVRSHSTENTRERSTKHVTVNLAPTRSDQDNWRTVQKRERKPKSVNTKTTSGDNERNRSASSDSKERRSRLERQQQRESRSQQTIRSNAGKNGDKCTSTNKEKELKSGHTQTSDKNGKGKKNRKQKVSAGNRNDTASKESAKPAVVDKTNEKTANTKKDCTPIHTPSCTKDSQERTDVPETKQKEANIVQRNDTKETKDKVKERAKGAGDGSKQRPKVVDKSAVKYQKTYSETLRLNLTGSSSIKSKPKGPSNLPTIDDNNKPRQSRKKCSPRITLNQLLSPKGKNSPRESPRTQKKWLTKDRKKRSPRDRNPDGKNKLKERRNKKKSSSRKYTDKPEETTESLTKVEDTIKGSEEKTRGKDVTAAMDSENLARKAAIVVNHAISEAVKVFRGEVKQSSEAESDENGSKENAQIKDVETFESEKLVTTATHVVNHVISEAVKVLRAEEKKSSVTDENEKLNRTASLILKEVFFLACEQYKRENILNEKDWIEIKKDAAVSQENHEVAIQSYDDGKDKSKDVQIDIDASKQEIRIDELDEFESVPHHPPGVTTSNDSLELRSGIRKIEPTGKTSEPNIHSTKEGQTLRSTKSEETSLCLESPSRGVELQNNSEGNMTSSTASRLEAIEHGKLKTDVNIPSVSIATNEEGSGESVAHKKEALQSLDDSQSTDHILE